VTTLLNSVVTQYGSDMMKYLDELKSLNLPKDKFAIFGSGPLAIRNMRENKDIDIIVNREL